MPDLDLPEFATDFLGNEIKEGDTVVYPTGGTSCRMVRAIVRVVRDLREHCYQIDLDTYDVANGRWIKATHKGWRNDAGRDGHRGPIAFKIVVNRLLAGDPDSNRWGIDDTDQLHRVVSISALERKAQSTHVIEVGDDLPWPEGELPTIKNIPLWGDSDV